MTSTIAQKLMLVLPIFLTVLRFFLMAPPVLWV